MERLCRELMNGEVDAVCFTTAIQVRSLFDFAKGRGYINEVKKAPPFPPPAGCADKAESAGQTRLFLQEMP